MADLVRSAGERDSSAGGTDVKLVWSEEKGNHLVAARALPHGTVVISAGAVAEGLDSLEHCAQCKRWVGPNETCIGCGFYTLCARCRDDAQPYYRRHTESGECRVLNALAMHVEINTEPAVLNTSVQLLKLLIKWVVSDGEWAYPGKNDVWARGLMDGKKLLTHESQRSEENVKAVYATAKFVRGLALKYHPRRETLGWCDVDTIAYVLMACQVNAYSILDVSTQRPIGVGLWPTGGMVNHSCCNNTDYLPDRDGKMQWVTISPVLEGEEFTVQYVDNLTSTTSERREYLRQEYYFECQCERCVGDQTYDVSLVKVDDEQHLNELSDLHSRAEVAMCESTEKACSLFQAALAHTPCKNRLHRLHYKSADGVLLCGKQSKHAQSLIVAARKILDFYERQPHEPHLPTSRVWALLKLARAYTWINRRAKRNDYAEEARMAVSRVIEILRPFQCDLSGLDWWLEELGSISGSLTVAEIFWGPNEL